MMAGKKTDTLPTKARFLGVCGQQKRTQEASVALMQREHRDSSKNGTSERTHIHTQRDAFPASDSHLGGKIW